MVIKMNVPKLRFREFNDEWKKEKFYSCVSITNGQVNPRDPKYCNLPHIGPGNIEKETGRLLDYNLAIYDKLISNKYLFDEKDIIYSKINPHFAKVCYPKFIGLCSADAYPIKPKDNKLISGFLLYLLLNPKFTKFATSVSMRTGMPKINRDELGLYNFNIPSIKEQARISDFLQLLDKKIELQSQKIEALKLYKLCILKYIFSSATIKTKLKSIGNIKKGEQINSEELSKSGSYYMLNGGTEPSGYLEKYNTLENTITISEGGNSCGYVKYNKCKFWCGGHCYSIENKMIDNHYLYQLLKFNENKIMRLRIGSGLPNIQKKDLENFELSIHEKNDQHKIAKLLIKFDTKIELEQDLLNLLLNLKKGLMQNMFV